MNFVLVLIFSIYLNCCLSYEEIDELIVQINDGEILGRYMTTESGKTISAFVGIPFASPPVGDLRFTAPQKVVPWNGTLFTQQECSKCPQIDSLIGSTVYEGNEDCLYLNVYVPERRTDDKLDVLVWFHGGVVFQIEKHCILLKFINILRGSLWVTLVHQHMHPIIY